MNRNTVLVVDGDVECRHKWREEVNKEAKWKWCNKCGEKYMTWLPGSLGFHKEEYEQRILKETS